MKIYEIYEIYERQPLIAVKRDNIKHEKIYCYQSINGQVDMLDQTIYKILNNKEYTQLKDYVYIT